MIDAATSMRHILFTLRPRRRWSALAALPLLGLALAGCGGSGSSAAPPASRHAGGAPVTGTTTTVAATGATTSTTSTLPGSGRPVVTIGDKNYTEQFVLGQLYLQALKAQGFSVNISDNIGAPAVIQQALKNGSLAMYPEYLDDFNAEFTHVHRRLPDRAAALAAARDWGRRHGLRLLSPTPFSDTDAIAVTVATATRHRLRTLGDLARLGDRLTVGGAIQLKTQRPGVPLLTRVYGVTPSAFQALAVGDQYDDLATGAVDAAYVNTTDGQLATGDYRVLGDPRRIFGYGNVVPVLSRSAEAAEGPAFAATIERVDRTLTLSAMRALNNAVDVAGEKPDDVAQLFLQTHGLLTPLRR
jgi:osmoprotectant transport system substrate-binding protein